VDENGGIYSQWDDWYDNDYGASHDGSYGIFDSDDESTFSDECQVCGCSCEFDSFGDRVCWCDSCQLSGCAYRGMSINRNGCLVCGCSSELDSFGDRICWCDSCQLTGCTYADMGLNHHECMGLSDNGCLVCGCSSELDSFGDRVCWCDSCQLAGCTMWEDMPIHNIRQVLHLLADVERRTALHLAYLRKWPHIRTPCCDVDYCFRCQTAWHDHQTCEEIAKFATVDVQFCPGCQVPTQRTEGCSSMVCLCGAQWHWDGDDDSDGDY